MPLTRRGAHASRSAHAPGVDAEGSSASVGPCSDVVMPWEARAMRATITNETVKTNATTTTIPSTSTPSWWTAAVPPPKKSPFGRFGYPIRSRMPSGQTTGS